MVCGGIVNHSICDTFHPFVHRLSPWATLLDYFSHEHRLLFVVSAGNIFRPYPVPVFDTIAHFQDAAPEVREAALIAAIEQSKGTRRLLTPAESINALTIGAVHGDNGPKTPAAGIDPYPNRTGLTSLVSALGLGANRSVKPDLVERGGRFLAAPSIGQDGFVQVHGEASFHVGQLVATPSPAAGDNAHVHRTSGTSNATALTTRSSHFIADALDEVFTAERVDWTTLETRAVLLKALLAHGCAWGDTGEFLDRYYPPQEQYTGQRRRQTITRFLGYGQPDHGRVVRGDLHRITLLGEDQIRSERRHDYRLPIPPSMINTREVRRIVLTLAWTTPVTNRTVDYRGVVLKICNPEGKSAFWEGVKRSEICQPTGSTANRGTLIHAVLEGKKLVTNEDGQLIVCVQAAQTHKDLATVHVPYAFAITIEMAQSQQSRLYAEVSAVVRAAVRPAIRAGTR
ncbi:MAG: S8 family serine peptidase [Nevskia sp.]|nr:S8 family serine peptidase [Nevskia sp.]